MKIIVLFFISIFLIMPGCLQNEIESSPKIEIIATNLDVPWSMDFLPNGDIIFTERPGRIRLIQNGILQSDELAKIEVAQTGEAGLLGLAVDPEFNKNNFIYVYYTYTNGSNLLNRVSRFTIFNNSAIDEHIIIDGIPGSSIHDGGRIKFGPDGLLYITTGDSANADLAQDKNSLAGSILRINKDGSIPSNNPYGSEIYSYGHRNPQGLAWIGNQLYASEHGPIGNDELNLIESGKNYQWPRHQCTDQDDPSIICFTNTLAPSGVASYGNDLYIGGLRGSKIIKVSFDKTGNIISRVTFIEGYGRIRDVVIEDNCLYVLTNNLDGRGLPGPDDDLIFKVSLE